MSDKTAKASRSATELNSHGIAQAFKRARVQDETTASSSTAPFLTVTDIGGQTTSNESIETVIHTHTEAAVRNTTRFLDRLYDKQARFESHKQFLQRCLQSAVTPRGLKIELEPSIGNHDEAFLTKWNEKLVKFSRELTQDVIEFCDSTIVETTAKITETKDNLVKSSTQSQAKEITVTLEKNQEDRVRNLRRNKDKKFNKLKYNISARPARQQYFTSDEELSDNRHSPQQQSRGGRNTWQRQDNNNNVRANRPYRNSRSRNNSHTNLFKPRTRDNSHTDLHAENKQDDRRKLIERVRLLESQVQNNTEPRSSGTGTQQNRHKSDNNVGQSSNRDAQPKKQSGAPSNAPGAIPQLEDMVKYITDTMSTLKTFKQQLTTLQNTNPTRSETY